MAGERRQARGRSRGAKPEPHPLVEALAPDPNKPPERATRLFGYPGASPEENATRLWLDVDLTSYVDIPDEAIRHSQTHGDDGTTIWVDPGATLTYGNVQSQQIQADFLSGPISQEHLAGAAAGGGPGPIGPVPAPTPALTVVAGCQPSVLRPCGFTQIPHCWYTETCWPTHIPPCWITRTPSVCHICPTWNILCHPTFTIQCQLRTHQPPCGLHQSVNIPCQSGPACEIPVVPPGPDPIGPIG